MPCSESCQKARLTQVPEGHSVTMSGTNGRELECPLTFTTIGGAIYARNCTVGTAVETTFTYGVVRQRGPDGLRVKKSDGEWNPFHLQIAFLQTSPLLT